MQAQYSQDPNKSNAHIRALPGENAYFLIRAPPQIRALPWEIQSLLVNFYINNLKKRIMDKTAIYHKQCTCKNV